MRRAAHTLPLAVLAGLALAAAPASAALLAFDDFSTYTDGNISGQTGSPVGFEAGAWSSGGITATTVSGGVVTSSGNGFRTHRALSPSISIGTVYIRTNLALGTAADSFQALELSVAENNGDTNAVRITGGANLNINVTGVGASNTAITTNDGANHEWLIELNLDTGAGQVWLDGNTAAFDPSTGASAFTASAGFSINAINLATFDGGSGPSVALDDIQIGQSWSDVGVNAIPEPSAVALLGLGGLALLRRRRK
ncbi:MAG: PEP-CTERM sorting domain-containing protein [Haloferula sp.]